MFLLAVCAGSSYATIVQDWDASWDNEYSPTESIFSLDDLTWDIVETGTSAFTSAGSISSSIWDECVGDPQFAVTLTVQNESPFIWVGYNFRLDPGGEATFFGDATTSGLEFQNVTYPDDKNIFFGGLDYVPIGDSVTFNFGIDVPNFGNSFTLTQIPVISLESRFDFSVLVYLQKRALLFEYPTAIVMLFFLC